MIRAVDLDDIETPIGYVDLDRVRANARRMAAYTAEHGLGWRPTSRRTSPPPSRRIQLEAGARGLSVATLREAEVMATLTDDLLLAYPPVGRSKLDRLVGLPERVDLKVALDELPVLTALSERAAAAGRTVGVLVELDMGSDGWGCRAPRPPSPWPARRRACLALPTGACCSIRGISHAPRRAGTGHGSPRRAPGEVLDALGRAGLPPGIVSGGSTPTLSNSHLVPGLTEVRPGSGIFFDKEALEIGVAGLDDVAYTVLATVVSTSVPGRAVVDAGSKSLTKEARGAANFGFLLDHPEVTLAGLSEEHAFWTSPAPPGAGRRRPRAHRPQPRVRVGEPAGRPPGQGR